MKIRPFTYVVAALAMFAFGASGLAQKAGGVRVETSYKGHADTVYAVALTPDGKLLATGSFDQTVKLWDVATGKEFRTYGGTTGHTKLILSLATSPDGSLLASGSADNTLKLWDIPVNAPTKSFPALDAFQRVALSADGTKAVLAGPGVASLVNVADFKDIGKFDAPGTTSVAWNAGATGLAAGSANGSLRIHSLAKGETTPVGAHRGAVTQVAFHPNGYYVSVGVDGVMRLWTPPTAPPKAFPPSPTVNGLSAFAGDGTLAIAQPDKSVRLFSPTTLKDLKSLPSAGAEPTTLAFGPGNTLAAAGLADGRVQLWTTADAKDAGKLLAHAGKVTALSLHPSIPQLATSGPDGLVKLWTLPLQPTRTAAHSSEVTLALPSPDGKKLTTVGADQIVRIFETGKMTLEKQFSPSPTPIVSAATLAAAVATGGADGAIRFWNPTTGKEADALFAHSDKVTALAVAPTGNQIVSTGADGTVKLWQVPSPAVKPMLHADQVLSAALFADGAKLATGGADRVVRVWNLGSLAKEKELTGPTLAVGAVAVSGDGRFVAAGSADKTLHLWTVADGKLLQKWTLPAAVQSVAFSPDHGIVAAGLADGAVKLFKTNDFKDPKEVKSFALGKGAVNSLAYKGDLIVAGCAANVVLVAAAADGAVKQTLTHTGPVVQFALTKDGMKLAAVAGKAVKAWTLADGKEILSATTPAEAKGVAWSPDATRLAIAGVDKFVRLLQADGELLESFAHEGPVHAVALLDAKRVVSVSADKTARVWASSLVWQKKHAGPVRALAVSAKGEAFAGGDDKVVRAWNVADGKELRAFAPLASPVQQLSLSADGTKLAALDASGIAVWNLAGKADEKPAQVTSTPAPTAIATGPAGAWVAASVGNEVRVIDVALGKAVQTFADHTGPVGRLAVLADGKTLASAGKDNAARLLPLASAGAFDAGPGGAVGVQYHVGGTQILVAGADKSLVVWDLAKKAAVKKFGPLADPIRSAGFSRDFTWVIAAAGKQVKLWNLADDKEIATLPHPADVRAFSIKTDKGRIATVAEDNQTRLWELPTGRELQYTTFADPTLNVYLDATAATLVTLTSKGGLVETPLVQKAIPAEVGAAHALAFAGPIALVGGAEKAPKAWSLANFQLDKLTLPATGGAVKAIAVAKTGQLVAFGGDDKVVRVHALPDGKELAQVAVSAPLVSLAFSPNSQMLVVTTADQKFAAYGTVYAPGQPLAPEFLKPIQTFSTKHAVFDPAILADNATLLVPAPDKTVQQWKVASPAPIKSLVHPNLVDCVAFHPKLPLVATGCHDGKIRLWDLVKGVVQKEIVAHVDKTTPNPIYTVAFSPDGSKILSSSYDKTLKLYDVPGGNFIREFKARHEKDFPKGHDEEVYAAAFSPDGTKIASGSGGQERVIKIWNVADGSVIRDLVNKELTKDPKAPAQSHPGWVYHLRFLRDGRLVSVGDAPKNKGYVALWNPNDGSQLAGETTDFGSLFGFALSGDEKAAFVGAGVRGRAKGDYNHAHSVRIPGLNP